MTNNTVVLLVTDLMSATRIESVLDALGFEAKIVNAEPAEDSEQKTNPVNVPGEPLSGRDGQFFDHITHWQPATIVVDLGDAAFPWRRWLAFLKSSPATRGIPVICFGPHVDVESLNRAKELNADVVVPRSRFFREMNALLSETVRRVDEKKILEVCREPLSAAALLGLEEFNKGNYYDAHEHLEDAWKEDTGEGRDLYRAILQVAVSYLQIERSNYAGAIKMILRSRQWFTPLPDICRGVNVGLLQNDAENVYNILKELGPDGISDFDITTLKPVETID